MDTRLLYRYLIDSATQLEDRTHAYWPSICKLPDGGKFIRISAMRLKMPFYRPFGTVVYLLCASVFSLLSAHAQESKQADLSGMSLEELAKLKVDTVYGASKFLQKANDAPASVTVVTAEQIQKFGYRTLADLLRAVPGFYVIYDRNYTYVGVCGLSRPGDYNARILFLLARHRVNDNV